MLLSVIALIITWPIYSVTIAGNFNNPNDMRYGNNRLKVMSYNVRLLNHYQGNKNKNTRQQLLQFIKNTKADVLCLQEFYDSNDSNGVNNIGTILKLCNYKYVATNKNFLNKRGFFGDVLFSKYPIINDQSLLLDTNTVTHRFQYADVVTPFDTIRFFNLHLQSIKLTTGDLKVLDGNWDDKPIHILEEGRQILGKLKISFSKRGNQASVIKNEIDNTPHPIIICGDFNDIPSSYTYFTIRGTLKDAFLQKGLGLGNTFIDALPILRIDNILYSAQNMQCQGVSKPNVTYSDHYPIIANFQFAQSTLSNGQ
jgi:endonuclease/exonuclease/phosphatase family metal-dependent hydrolase